MKNIAILTMKKLPGGKDRKGRTPPDVLKRRMKERKERDIQDRKDEDARRKIEKRGDDDIFLSDDEKVQDALKQLERLAEEDSVTASYTLQSSATNAEEYDEAAEEEIEDMHGCLRRCLHGGFPQFMGQEPPPTSSCPCYNCCMASLTPEFSEVTHEGDHEENDNAGIDDEREEGMHDADDDVEEESQSLPLQCGCRHCCMLNATFLAKAAAATAE